MRTTRGARRFIADLLAGRRPRSFRAHDADVGPLRAAITLRAARPDSAEPRAEFRTELHQRLAAALNSEQPTPDVPPLRRPGPVVDGTRRRVVAATGVAAAAAAIGAVADHTLITRTSPPVGHPNRPPGQQTLTPNTGQWRTVSVSTDLPEGGVHSFDLGTVTGYVTRTGGALQAVSGVCTHLGCRLTLDPAARRLNCPCHTTSFALDGELLRYQLAVPPPPLPKLQVRETHGVVQIYAP